MENRNETNTKTLMEMLRDLGIAEVDALLDAKANSDEEKARQKQAEAMERKRILTEATFLRLLGDIVEHYSDDVRSLGIPYVQEMLREFTPFEIYIVLESLKTPLSERGHYFSYESAANDLKYEFAPDAEKLGNEWFTSFDGKYRPVETWEALRKKVQNACFAPDPGDAHAANPFFVSHHTKALNANGYRSLYLGVLVSQLVATFDYWKFAHSNSYDGISYVVQQARSATTYVATKFLLQDDEITHIVEGVTYAFFPVRHGQPASSGPLSFDCAMLAAFLASRDAEGGNQYTLGLEVAGAGFSMTESETVASEDE